MNDKHLDDFIRQRVSNAEITPPPSVWEKVEASQQPSRRPYLYAAAAVVALLMALPLFLRQESPYYEPRETVMTPIEDRKEQSPFADIIDEMNDAEQQTTVQSQMKQYAATMQNNHNFADKAQSAMTYLDSLDVAAQRKRALRDIDLMAVDLIEQKVKRLEMEAISEDLWHTPEQIAMEQPSAKNIIPTIRKVFHPDYYVTVDLENISKVRLPTRSSTEKQLIN